ncbi:atp-dependent dna helicase [Fusarium sp. NRRL 52700]|nr:atp-dependent dna helicase [Fusarium sp. NRRL 52700]
MGQILNLVAQAPSREKLLIGLILSISSSTEQRIPWDSYAESEENKLLSGKLRKKYLELSEGWDTSVHASSILPPDAHGDILSQELRRLSQRPGLKEFLVKASVDTTIFWPSSQDMERKPTWPTLELLRIAINDVLPSGEWVEIRDPEDSDDELADDIGEDERLESVVPGEEHGRRFNPIFNPVHFDQFALAIARAASQMPMIEEVYLNYQGCAPMSIRFVTRNCFTWEGKKKPHLEFSGDTASIMYPSTETMEAWRGTLALHNLEWNVHFADNGSQYQIADF